MKKKLNTIIIILSVMLLFSCTTTEKVKNETVITETLESEESVSIPQEEENEIFPSESERAEIKEKEDISSEEDEDESKRDVIIEENTLPVLPDVPLEDGISGEEEVPDDSKETSENAVEEETVPEESPLIEEEENTLESGESGINEEYTSLTIERLDDSDTVSSFSYAFGVMQMRGLIEAESPFVTSYFLRGMYDAYNDWKSPVFVSLGNLQQTINDYYNQSTGIEHGERPESTGELLSLANPENGSELFSYAFGFSAMSELISQDTELDIIQFFAGMLDTLYSSSSPLTEEEIDARYNAYFIHLNTLYYSELEKTKEENLKKAEEFLNANRETDGITVLDNGVQLLMLAQDDTVGGKPTQYSTVILDYNEYVLDYDTGELKIIDADSLAEFSLINLSNGLQSALTAMHTGQAVRAFIPPELTRMSDGNGDDIEPNSIFVYDLALQKIL